MGKIASLKKLALMGAIREPIKLSSIEFSSIIDSSPQTASRRLLTLEQEGLISRTIVPDGQWITITKKGVEVLKEEYYEYQKIFSSDEDYLVLLGSVMTGLGEGQYYISQEGYRRQFVEKLGFFPFPGTLNLKLSEQSVSLRKKMEEREGIPISSFRSENRTFGGGKCFKGVILNNSSDIECAVIVPERTHYPPSVLELLSPFFLREKLGLKDGDEVRVKVMI
ncbi:MAG: winged helix-turn-helix domain-containing protein/riboflavin kinase [Candidatus Syntropharchaeia archaeon]